MTSNLTNQNAIDMAKEADPAGKRTLGIVTKPDRAVSADTNALDQLGSGAFQMGLGFVVVSCRRQLSCNCRHDKIICTTAVCLSLLLCICDCPVQLHLMHNCCWNLTLPQT